MAWYSILFFPKNENSISKILAYSFNLGYGMKKYLLWSEGLTQPNSPCQGLNPHEFGQVIHFCFYNPQISGYIKNWLTQDLNEFVVRNKEGRIILSIKMLSLYKPYRGLNVHK